MSLTIRGLNVKLQKEEILHEVNLEIKEGEFVSLLGTSGCGKSTLLKSIAGLLEIESGDILIHGNSVKDIAPEKRGAVIVFQDLRLFPHMTVEKNITFPMELKKIPRKEQMNIVKNLLEEVQLCGYENRKIREMSGGQLQRVALARALAAQPSVLLLDEPFSGLDEKLRMEMGSLVKKIHQEKRITTILVTHDKREALQMSDRIALMQNGDILQYDTPKNIFYKPVSKDVAEYFGKANYIKGYVTNHIFRSNSGGVELYSKQIDGRYEAMVRPFSIKPVLNGTGYSISDITFMGDMEEIVLNTPDGEVCISSMSSEPIMSELKVGTEIGIEIDEAAVRYFQ